MKAELNTFVVRADHLLSSELDDEIVMMDVESGSYFSMPGPSGRIWQLLETGQTVKTVKDALLMEYDVTPDQCEAELLPFVNTLIDRGLVKIVNGEK